MNCNAHVFYKMIFSNKFGFSLETSLFLYILNFSSNIAHTKAFVSQSHRDLSVHIERERESPDAGTTRLFTAVI